MKKLTEEQFNLVKKPLYNRFTRPKMLAKKYDLSLKTVLMIRGSQNYVQYQEQSKAQHPDVKFSLADQVLHLHKLTFKKDNSYLPPNSARVAIGELIRSCKP